MSKILFLITLFSIGMPSHFLMPQNSNRQLQQSKKRVDLELGSVKPIKAVLRIAEKYRVPLGIVLGSHPLLCSQARPTTIHADSMLEAFKQAVAGTGYTTTRYGDRYVISAPDLTPHQEQVLNYRFDRFSATETTMNDAGQLLTGYVNTTIEGAQGFITASSVGSRSETFSIRLKSATTLEIANQIVSQNPKGVWVFRTASETISMHRGRSVIMIYAYDRDAADLEGISCGEDRSVDK